ncbi:P-loop containing nucleoside triphosphate hydrolase protein [Neocallimastix sp. 'constans']|jgi:small GTP-binding protein
MKKDILKVVLIGDGGVGKTSIRVQYIHRRFTSNYKATIGADFITKDVQLEDDKKVTMQIWDTAGQERFQSLGIAYYRGADACIIVFDVTNPDSFSNVLRWEHEFIEKADLKDPSTYPFVLIGNKIDNEDDRIISRSHGKRMAIKMREQSIKEDPHYSLIQQSKYISEYDNNQSYHDNLLAIYQRSSSYKKYNYAEQKNNQNHNKKNNKNQEMKRSFQHNFKNHSMVNTDSVEAMTHYSIYRNNNYTNKYKYNDHPSSNGSCNTNNPLQEDEDEDSTVYDDYDDLENYRIPYFEVSAKYGENVEAVFYHIAKTVQLPQFEFLIEGDTINWDDDDIKNTSGCCF